MERGVKSRLPILFILLTTLLDEHSSYFTRILPNNLANYAEDNRGGYCELHPSCTCVNNKLGSYVHCPGIANIILENDSPVRSVSLQCYPEISVDPFNYLSIVEFETDEKQKTGVIITDCPAPKNSYVSYFLLKDKAKQYSEDPPFPTSLLTIICGSMKNFSLEIRHFDGLTDLECLEIRCRALEVIPHDLLRGVSEKLQSLRLVDTSVKYIPHDFISKFTVLLSVDFKNNRIKDLPEDIFSSNTQLVTLKPENSEKETYIERGLFQNESITYLDIGRNRLEKLPKGLFSLLNLRDLRINDNLLEYIEPDLFNLLRSLENLHISGNGIHRYEPVLITLQQLDLSYNNLKTLPEKIFLSNIGLNKLNVSSNLLIRLPPRLLEMSINLTYLDLSNNSISDLSESFLSKAVSLEHLNLSKNRIRYLGNNFFSGVKVLRHVDLSYNVIEVLADEIFLPFKQSVNLVYLNLQGNMLTYLPNLTVNSLKILNLAGNNFTNITMESFRLLHRLEYLNLSSNHIQCIEVPRHLSYRRIKSLDLSHNFLNITIDMTNPFQTFTLQVFNISGNLIKGFRTGITNLQSLYFLIKMEYLDMSSNNMLYFDIEAHHRPVFYVGKQYLSMKYLDLSKNKLNFSNIVAEYDYQIKTWGYRSQLHRFKNLEVLLLHHNEIAVIPMDWRHSLPKLRLIDLRYNKIKYLGHYDLLYSNGITPLDLRNLGSSEKDYIKKAQPEVYYQFSNAHKLTVDLRYNLIQGTELSEDQMMRLHKGCLVEDNFAHAAILLGHNPFICGCQVFLLLRYALKEARLVAERERYEGYRLIMPAAIDIDGLTCWEPLSVRSKNVSDPESWIHHFLPLLGLCDFSYFFERTIKTHSLDGCRKHFGLA